MTSFQTHYESLPKAQRALLPELADIRKLGFILYGGTALALRLGHRDSVDFDFFSEKALDESAITELPFFARSIITQQESHTLSLAVGQNVDQVRLSFFGKISFGRVGEPGLTDDGFLCVASLDDIFATKLKVLLQRVEVKDYLDIVALLESGASLERGLGAAQTLYGSTFPPSEALRALTYFEEGDFSQLKPRMRKLLFDCVERCGEVRPVPIISPSLSNIDQEQPYWLGSERGRKRGPSIESGS